MCSPHLGPAARRAQNRLPLIFPACYTEELPGKQHRLNQTAPCVCLLYLCSPDRQSSVLDVLGFFFKLLLQDDCMAKKVYSIHCIIVSALRLWQAFRQSSRLGAEQHMWCNPLFSEGHFHLHLCLQLCTCGFSSRTELCCSAFGSGKCRSDYIFSCAINF